MIYVLCVMISKNEEELFLFRSISRSTMALRHFGSSPLIVAQTKVWSTVPASGRIDENQKFEIGQRENSQICHKLHTHTHTRKRTAVREHQIKTFNQTDRLTTQ